MAKLSIKFSIYLLGIFIIANIAAATGESCNVMDAKALADSVSRMYTETGVTNPDVLLALSLGALNSKYMGHPGINEAAYELCISAARAKGTSLSSTIVKEECLRNIRILQTGDAPHSISAVRVEGIFDSHAVSLRIRGDVQFSPDNGCVADISVQMPSETDSEPNFRLIEQMSRYTITYPDGSSKTNADQELECDSDRASVEGNIYRIPCYARIYPLRTDESCQRVSCRMSISDGTLTAESEEAQFLIPNYKCVPLDIRGNPDTNIDYVYSVSTEFDRASDPAVYEACGDYKILKDGFMSSLTNQLKQPILNSINYADPGNPGRYSDRINFYYVNAPSLYSEGSRGDLVQKHTLPYGALGLCEDVDVLGVTPSYTGAGGWVNDNGVTNEGQFFGGAGNLYIIKRGISFFIRDGNGLSQVHEFGHAAFWFPEEYTSSKHVNSIWSPPGAPAYLTSNWGTRAECESSLRSEYYLLKEGERRGRCSERHIGGGDPVYIIEDNDPMEVRSGVEFKGLQRSLIQWVFEESNFGRLFNDEFNRRIRAMDPVSTSPTPAQGSTGGGGLSDEW